MAEALSQEELEAEHCWDPTDVVPGRSEMTGFRRRLRLHQARWRASNGYPMGTQPIVPKRGGPRPRPVGSRLPLDFARETGANFLGAGARDAARARTSFTEPHQSLDHQRLWADLLWSPALAFNLFGALAADLALADRAVHTWWPDTPGMVSEVRFAHSPGWLDPAYLGNLAEFDAAFVLDLRNGTRGIIAVGTKYHDHIKAETPKPTRAPHYRRVAKRSGAFKPRAIDTLNGRGPLLVMWLRHLLMLSMLQHPSGDWTWGRYVLVHPAGNSDFADACARYQEMLADPPSFSSVTQEELLGAAALPARAAAALRNRYVVAPEKATSSR